MPQGLRAGVIGLGWMGWEHVTGWRDAGADVHVYDMEAAVRARAADRIDSSRVHDTLEGFLEAVDAVSVCTPTFAHAEVAMAVASKVRGIVCEKPLTRTLEEADALIARCEQHGVQLYPAQVVRFFPQYARARAAVASGRIGTPAVLRLSRVGAAPALDKWYHDVDRSGGILSDLMVHDIDYARWVAGDVVRVLAHTMRPAGPYDGPTHAYAVLTHASGAISHITASWGPPDTEFRTSFEIAGSEGLVRGSTDSQALQVSPPELAKVAGDAISESPWSAEIREFAAAIEGGPAPRVSAHDGRQALAVALAAAESALSGRAVEL